MAENSLSLNKTMMLFAAAAGMIIMAAVFATVPPSGRLEAHERGQVRACHTEQVSLDQGYGVSRVAERRVCDE